MNSEEARQLIVQSMQRPLPRDGDTLTEFATAAWEVTYHLQEASRRIAATQAFLGSAAVVHNLKSRGLVSASFDEQIRAQAERLELLRRDFNRLFFGEHFAAPEVALPDNPLHGGGTTNG